MPAFKPPIAVHIGCATTYTGGNMFGVQELVESTTYGVLSQLGHHIISKYDSN
jgi:hypothetical protein